MRSKDTETLFCPVLIRIFKEYKQDIEPDELREAVVPCIKALDERLYELDISSISGGISQLDIETEFCTMFCHEYIKKLSFVKNKEFKIGEHGLIPFAKYGETIIRENGARETPIVIMETKPFEECSDEQLNEFKNNGFVEMKSPMK